MESRFHQAALRELRLTYNSDARALEELAQRASAIGATFPASFVEWYGMRDGISLLRQHSNSDDPVEIADLEAPVELGDGPGRVLRFMTENQGVNWWGIQLDAGDDPPVFVAVDPDFAWRPHAESFSTFMACQIWDHHEVFGGLLLAAQERELAAAELDLLRRRFREKTTTHGWPTRNIFRFEREDARLIVWDGEWQADWWLSARSEDALAALARDLWSCADLSSSLYGTDERSERVLRLLRQQR